MTDFRVKNGLITEANNVTVGNNFFISNTGKVGIGTAPIDNNSITVGNNFFISNTGKVGIGTDPTEYFLTVDSSNTVWHAIRAYSSVSSAVAGTGDGGAANCTGVYGGAKNTVYGLLGHYNSDTGLYYSLYGNGKGYFANNVGIACTSPTVALDVVGNTKISGSLTANSLSFSGIGYSSSVSAGNQTGVTGIPTWARRIDVLIYDVKHTEVAQSIIQLGYDGNWLQDNYNSVGTAITASSTAVSRKFNQGISWALGFYAVPSSGIVTFEKWGSSNVWVASGTFSSYQNEGAGTTAGRIDLGASASSYYNVRIGNVNGFNGFTGSFVCQWS